LYNLKEAYLSFKEKNPKKQLGFAEFAELLLTKTVLAGMGGMHAVYVYTIHKCVKLMISVTKLCDLTQKQVKT
jgi:hypothetical protein